jgi:hypothetical protein
MDHRKGVVSGAKEVLKVASKVLDAIPVGGSAAKLVLDAGATTLESVQVISHISRIRDCLIFLGAAILGEP